MLTRHLDMHVTPTTPRSGMPALLQIQSVVLPASLSICNSPGCASATTTYDKSCAIHYVERRIRSSIIVLNRGSRPTLTQACLARFAAAMASSHNEVRPQPKTYLEVNSILRNPAIRPQQDMSRKSEIERGYNRGFRRPPSPGMDLDSDID